MEVDRGPDDVDLGVHQAAQADRDRRDVALEESRVADDPDVGGEPVAVRDEPALERRGTRLLVALEDELDVDRERPAGGEERLRGAEVHVDLTLVIRRAAGEHPAVDHGRLEGRRLPQIERIDRLDVVVAVDQGGRRVGRAQPVAVHDGMTRRVRHLDVVDADPAQVVRDPLRGAPAVGGVLRKGGDARDPEECLVGLEALVGAGVEPGLDLRIDGGGAGGGHAGMVRGGRREGRVSRTCARPVIDGPRCAARRAQTMTPGRRPGVLDGCWIASLTRATGSARAGRRGSVGSARRPRAAFRAAPALAACR